MSANLPWASAAAGLILIAGNIFYPLPFWTEAVGFTLILVSIKLYQPTMEHQWESLGRRVYWLLLALVTGFAYVRWFY